MLMCANIYLLKLSNISRAVSFFHSICSPASHTLDFPIISFVLVVGCAFVAIVITYFSNVTNVCGQAAKHEEKNQYSSTYTLNFASKPSKRMQNNN